ncbi:arf-GAP with coiled-coil, ANK repeat and PH domain-containing protein 2 [Culicoides brevitarsis]|uniref:arf-GAP with coiled-coil, ANK repeat and PH domain-containing protein 2 n=1 Tax=Culicoides brevitarsis TaxID=469753 RepID=UPI00307B3676
MTCKLNLVECLRDSPSFRLNLEEEERGIEHLETKLDKVVKACQAAVDQGKEFVAAQSAFATSLWDLQKHFQDDKSSHNALAKLIHLIQEMNKFHTTLLDQANRSVLKTLTAFLKKNVKEVKDSKILYNKVSENMDTALYKNAQVNKNRPLEITETENYLSATTSCFRHTALDYVNAITLLQSRKKMEILSALLSYIQACSTYYHQGSDLCEDFAPYFKTLDDEIGNMRTDHNQLEKLMQNRHALVTEFTEKNGDIKNLINNLEPSDVEASKNNKEKCIMEGYLFKRTSNAFKTWNRRWFCMKDNKLYYRKRTGEDMPTVMEEDLRICHVRRLADSDRRFCFEVLSPNKSHTLQADTEEQMQAWIAALHRGIDNAIHKASVYSENMCNVPTSSTSKNDSENSIKKINWQQILTIPGNKSCCDCGNPEPKWASINLGITLCIACSGVHRSLGVHYSKVRSLTLDVWEPEVLRVLFELGNDTINQIYESYIPSTCELERATEHCDRTVREAWIRAKYIDRKFVMPLQFGDSPRNSANVANNNNRDADGVTLRGNVPGKWSVLKTRRRSCQRRTKPRMEVDEDKDLDSTSSQRSDILIIGENFKAATTPGCGNDNDETTNNTPQVSIGHSDQESTSGEEDIIDEEEMDKLNPNYLLYKAALAHNIPVMCQALALGANKNWENSQDFDRTALHQAILSGSLMSCEFLLLNGSNIDAVDRNGETALHLATEKGFTQLAYLLLKHKANYNIENKSGKKAIDIAVDQTNADIVTMLRLTQLNEEIGNDGDGDTIGDNTYNEVMRDFCNLSHNQPQKLVQRNNIRGSGEDSGLNSDTCTDDA